MQSSADSGWIVFYGQQIEEILSTAPAEATRRLMQAYQVACDKDAFMAAFIGALVLERNLHALRFV
ncbi:MAG: hypothetical protein VB131_09500 [Burkholderia gladioli]